MPSPPYGILEEVGLASAARRRQPEDLVSGNAGDGSIASASARMFSEALRTGGRPRSSLEDHGLLFLGRDALRRRASSPENTRGGYTLLNLVVETCLDSESDGWAADRCYIHCLQARQPPELRTWKLAVDSVTF